PRVVAHVHPLALDLARFLDQQLDVDVQRPAEREVLGPALLLGVLRLPELVVEELELHDLAGEVLDRADLVEELAQSPVDEPAERFQLELDQVRDGENLGDPGIALARQRCLPDGRRISGRQHEAPLLGGGQGDGRGPRSQNCKVYRWGEFCQTPRTCQKTGVDGSRPSATTVPRRTSWPIIAGGSRMPDRSISAGIPTRCSPRRSTCGPAGAPITAAPETPVPTRFAIPAGSPATV